MSQAGLDDIRRHLRRHLEIDALIGLQHVPFPTEAARILAGTTGTSVKPPPRIKPRPAAAEPASHPRRPAAAVQSGGLPPEERAGRLQLLDEQRVQGCRKCQLCETRTQTVFGQGSAKARLVFVGEAPGFEEDRQGQAFVGRAGQLLTRMIEAMGLTREEVFICNVLKCRPPNNRTPATDEIAACSPYLFEQLQIIQPELLCALGAPAAQTLLNTTDSIGRLRGRFHDFYLSGTPLEGDAIPLMATYHPAYLLRTPSEKKKAWADLKLIMQRMGLKDG